MKSKNVKRTVPNLWKPEDQNSFKERWKRYLSGESALVQNLAYYYEVDYASMS